MVRQTGSNTLSISGRDRLGAPVGEMARSVLSQDLAQRMPKGTVILPNAPSSPSTAHLVVNIARFTEEEQGRVQLAASWTLMRGQPAQPVLNRDVNLQCSAGGNGAQAQAAAMSELLSQLAGHIATDVTANSTGIRNLD